uniref:Uncharacterized protein n=1 Tax=Timema poppense TaxID=170557 RepID=A0A7R9DX11_TIMPO|nr:unnamed protein product [Timema poppensis]
MLSIISSGNKGCCSSAVPIHEPPLPLSFVMAVIIDKGRGSRPVATRRVIGSSSTNHPSKHLVSDSQKE